jgi:cytochrome b
MEQGEIRVWDPFVRIFHWMLVLLFVLGYLTGDRPLSPHVYAGYAVFALVLLRVLWGVVGTTHARFSDFVYRPAAVLAYVKETLGWCAKRYLGHNPAGGAMIVLILVSLLLVSISGFAIYGLEKGTGPLAMLGSASGAEDGCLIVHALTGRWNSPARRRWVDCRRRSGLAADKKSRVAYAHPARGEMQTVARLSSHEPLPVIAVVRQILTPLIG